MVMLFNLSDLTDVSLKIMLHCCGFGCGIVSRPLGAMERLCSVFFFLACPRAMVQINILFQRKIISIFLPILLAYVLAAKKNRLVKKVLLSIHNICFG